MKKVVTGVAGILVLALAVGQILPLPPAENPPVEGEVDAPPQVMAVLRTSCYDCHSHETVWPWYSHVVPAKWLVRSHVVEGRGALNFSAWNGYDANRRGRKRDEVAEMVESGEMPLAGYVVLHKEAALTQAEAQLLVAWARAGAHGTGAGDGPEERADTEDPGTR